MAKPESRLQRRIRKALKREFGGVWYKVWGGPYQPAGIPDLCGVVNPKRDDPNLLHHAVPVYVEVKCDDGVVSAVQVHRMQQLAAAGAVVCVATTPDEAIDRVRRLVQDPGSRFCLHCMDVVPQECYWPQFGDGALSRCPSCRHPL